MLESPALETAFDIPERNDLTEEGLPPLATVCVVGLGYVGLPVAIEFGKRRPTVGFDLATRKIERLRQFHDATGEIASEELRRAEWLHVTDDPARIAEADFVIIAVPTPVNAAHR